MRERKAVRVDLMNEEWREDVIVTKASLCCT